MSGTNPVKGTVTGANLVLGADLTDGTADIWGIDPRTGRRREPAARSATPDEVDRAAQAAADAADDLAGWSRSRRAELLEGIARRLDGIAEELVATAAAETGLTAEPRLVSELGRTTGQLRFLAEVVEDGAYLEASLDRSDAGVDVRRMLIPVGPVAVFGASNFPLAFSVPGGDTAAALAVGCPVVAKAHPAHPHTSELSARAISAALADAGAPAGAFGLVHGVDAGRRLVAHPGVAAVSFTGSKAGGLALAELARQRPVPIPVFAEMGSLNPVIVTPAAMRTRAQEIADGLLTSVSASAGQLCTKPGIVLIPAQDDVPDLAGLLAASLALLPAQPLLTSGIAEAWGRWIEQARQSGADVVASPVAVPTEGIWARPVVVTVDAARFVDDDHLREECFGPLTVLVRYRNQAELEKAAGALGGSLTGTVQAGSNDDPDAHRAAELLTARVGRLIWNGWPTGVAVTWSMQHGGPYPATLDATHTSVGAAALQRFLRPVSYQGVPAAALPPELRDDPGHAGGSAVRREEGILRVRR